MKAADTTASLPTLIQLVQALRKQNEQECSVRAWADEPSLGGIAAFTKWSFPMKDFVNEEDDDAFIVVQTQQKRHTLKPNLARRHYLYRGQNRQYSYVLSSFSRDDLPGRDGKVDWQKSRDKHIVANLKAEEFCCLLSKHPLLMMLDRGICLPPERKPVFLNMNYYGLAQHYGFKTGLVDFTTDLDVAAFFACTECVGFDQYKPITDTKKYPAGVIYVHGIHPGITFKGIGFTTIGLQIFPRSGAQKGVLFNEGVSSLPLDDLVAACPFRHDATVSRHFYKMMEDGKRLFPDDSIARHAKAIIDSSEVSGCVFADNLFTNQDDFQENLEAIQREGISVDWHRRPRFTQVMLNELEQDLKNGLWEHFCNQICFVDPDMGLQMRESLLRLPQNPAYSYYFKKEEYSRIAVGEEELHIRAERNKKDIVKKL